MASIGPDGASAQSDIYSLGCVAFWLLTGTRVFQAETPLDMIIKHASEDPCPPSQISELEIPAELDHLILRCLAKDPQGRPSSIDVLAHELAEIEAGNPWTDADARKWWAMHMGEPRGDTGAMRQS